MNCLAQRLTGSRLFSGSSFISAGTFTSSFRAMSSAGGQNKRARIDKDVGMWLILLFFFAFLMLPSFSLAGL